LKQYMPLCMKQNLIIIRSFIKGVRGQHSAVSIQRSVISGQ
jgi:hypothetical protein